MPQGQGTPAGLTKFRSAQGKIGETLAATASIVPWKDVKSAAPEITAVANATKKAAVANTELAASQKLVATSADKTETEVKQEVAALKEETWTAEQKEKILKALTSMHRGLTQSIGKVRTAIVDETNAIKAGNTNFAAYAMWQTNLQSKQHQSAQATKAAAAALKQKNAALKASVPAYHAYNAAVQKSTGIMGWFISGVNQIRGTTSGLQHMLGAIRNQLLLFAFAFGSTIAAMKTFFDEARKSEAALKGLQSVAANTGSNMILAKDAAVNLAKTGLMSIQESASGLKNLLAAGFNLPQAIRLMDALTDSAAFNRQGQLSLGEAIVGATEGIKNQNSIMVDNAGITKNLSIMYKEYASSIGTTAGALDEAQKRMAVYTGILKEATVFQGNAQLVLTTTSGALTQFTAQLRQMSIAMGELLGPGAAVLIDTISGIAKSIGEWAERNKDLLQQGFTDRMKELRSVFSAIITVLGKLGEVLSYVWDRFGEIGVRLLEIWMLLRVGAGIFLRIQNAVMTFGMGAMSLDLILKRLGARYNALTLQIQGGIRDFQRAGKVFTATADSMFAVGVASTTASKGMTLFQQSAILASGAVRGLGFALRGLWKILGPIAIAFAAFELVQWVVDLNKADDALEEYNKELAKTSIELDQINRRLMRQSDLLLREKTLAQSSLGLMKGLAESEILVVEGLYKELEFAAKGVAEFRLQMLRATNEQERKMAKDNFAAAKEDYDAMESIYSEHLSRLKGYNESYAADMESSMKLSQDLLKEIGQDSPLVKVYEDIVKFSQRSLQIAESDSAKLVAITKKREDGRLETVTVGAIQRLAVETVHQDELNKLLKAEASKLLSIQRQINTARMQGLESTLVTQIIQLRQSFASEKQDAQNFISDLKRQVAALSIEYNLIISSTALALDQLNTQMKLTMAFVEDNIRKVTAFRLPLAEVQNQMNAYRQKIEASGQKSSGNEGQVIRRQMEALGGLINLQKEHYSKYAQYQDQLEKGIPLTKEQTEALDKMQSQFDKGQISTRSAIEGNGDLQSIYRFMVNQYTDMVRGLRDYSGQLKKVDSDQKILARTTSFVGQLEGLANDQRKAAIVLLNQLALAEQRSVAQAERKAKQHVQDLKYRKEIMNLGFISAIQGLESGAAVVLEIFSSTNKEIDDLKQGMREAWAIAQQDPSKAKELAHWISIMNEQLKELKDLQIQQLIKPFIDSSANSVRNIKDIFTARTGRGTFATAFLGENFEAEKSKIGQAYMEQYKKIIDMQNWLLDKFKDDEAARIKIKAETERTLTDLTLEYSLQRQEIARTEALAWTNAIGSAIGGFQNLGASLYEVSVGIVREGKALQREQEDQLAQGEITQAQFTENLKRIDEKMRKDREKIWAGIAANIVRSVTTAAGAALMEYGAKQLIQGTMLAADATKMAAYYTGMAAVAAMNPLTAPLAGLYAAQATAAVGVGAAAGAAGIGLGIGMIAAGAGVQTAGGFAAAAIEGNNPGGTFEAAPGQVGSTESERRTGGTIKAENLDIFIQPVVYINGQQIFIGSGAVSEFIDEVQDMLTETVQSAVDRGEIDLSNVTRRVNA